MNTEPGEEPKRSSKTARVVIYMVAFLLVMVGISMFLAGYDAGSPEEIVMSKGGNRPMWINAREAEVFGACMAGFSTLAAVMTWRDR